MRRILIVAIAAAAALAMPACESLATDAEVTAGLAQFQAAEESAIAAAESALDPVDKAEALAAAESYAAMRGKLAEAADNIAAAQRDAEAQAQAVGSIGALVPGVGTAVGVGSGFLVAALSFLGQMRWRRVARQIIDGFEAAQSASPDLASAIDEAAPMIHSAMDLRTIAVVKSELARRRANSGAPARNRRATPPKPKPKRPKREPTPA